MPKGTRDSAKDLGPDRPMITTDHHAFAKVCQLHPGRGREPIRVFPKTLDRPGVIRKCAPHKATAEHTPGGPCSCRPLSPRGAGQGPPNSLGGTPTCSSSRDSGHALHYHAAGDASLSCGRTPPLITLNDPDSLGEAGRHADAADEGGRAADATDPAMVNTANAGSCRRSG